RHNADFEQELARAARADTELVFLFTDREPRHGALDEKCRDAAITRRWIDGCEDDEYVGFVGVRYPQFPARDAERIAGFDRAGRESEGVAARARLRQRVRTDGTRGERREKSLLLFFISPAQQRVDDQRVLYVNQH